MSDQQKAEAMRLFWASVKAAIFEMNVTIDDSYQMSPDAQWLVAFGVANGLIEVKFIGKDVSADRSWALTQPKEEA